VEAVFFFLSILAFSRYNYLFVKTISNFIMFAYTSASSHHCSAFFLRNENGSGQAYLTYNRIELTL
jgi:hypothetical protein